MYVCAHVRVWCLLDIAAIRCVPSARRLVLSGTPIQNNLQELWSLFDYVCEQRLLGPYRTFKVDYEGHILRYDWPVVRGSLSC